MAGRGRLMRPPRETATGAPGGSRGRRVRLPREESRRVFGTLEFHQLPRLLVLEQRAQERVVHRVSGLVAAERADERVAEEVKVADGVENLVLHELVLVAQTVAVEHAVFVHHDRVVETAA